MSEAHYEIVSNQFADSTRVIFIARDEHEADPGLTRLSWWEARVVGRVDDEDGTHFQLDAGSARRITVAEAITA